MSVRYPLSLDNSIKVPSGILRGRDLKNKERGFIRHDRELLHLESQSERAPVGAKKRAAGVFLRASTTRTHSKTEYMHLTQDS